MRLTTSVKAVIGLGTVLVLSAGGAASDAASGPGVFDIDSLLEMYPLGKDQPMRSDVIAFDSASSMHLTQVEGGIESHRHVYHDENVWVVRGAGQLTLGKDKRRVLAGQVIHIPRNTPHSFYSLGSKPAVVISVFSPGFDGKDRVYDVAPSEK